MQLDKKIRCPYCEREQTLRFQSEDRNLRDPFIKKCCNCAKKFAVNPNIIFDADPVVSKLVWEDDGCVY